ncbi:MAG: FAD:protein FMN transferase, partial [Bacteroidia bacterium]|nr:FAD:protein FMN transferase [Bacteroidia bacterium]
MNRFFILLFCLAVVSCKKKAVNSKIAGSVFGTSYSIIYNSETDYENEFNELFYEINRSMSTYIPFSDISKINRNEAVEVDSNFIKVFETSKAIYRETDGA